MSCWAGSHRKRLGEPGVEVRGDPCPEPPCSERRYGAESWTIQNRVGGAVGLSVLACLTASGMAMDSQRQRDGDIDLIGRRHCWTGDCGGLVSRDIWYIRHSCVCTSSLNHHRLRRRWTVNHGRDRRQMPRSCRDCRKT